MRIVKGADPKPARSGRDAADGEKAFAAFAAVAALVAILLLSGCGSLGIRSFGDALGAAYLTIDTVADAVWQECQNAVSDGPCVPESAISTEDKQQAKQLLTDALMLVDEARILYVAGSVDLAGDRLLAANAILDAVEQLLIARGAR